MENLTPQQTQEAIDAIRGDPGHAYNNLRHPGHRGAVAKMEGLYAQMQAKGSESNEPHSLSYEERQTKEAGDRITALKGNKTFMAAYIKGDKDAVQKMTKLYQTAHPHVDKEGNLISPPEEEDDDEENSDTHDRDPTEFSPEVNELVNLANSGDIEDLGDEVISALSSRFDLTSEDESFIRYLQRLADPADSDDKEFLCDLVLWIGAKIASQQE